MPPKKEPEGSVANLPEMQEIIAAEESREVDIDEMFGATVDDDDNGSPPEGAGASPGASDAGAGAGVDQGSSPAPDNSGQQPGSPTEGAAPGQPATQGDGTSSAPAAQPGQQPPAAGTPPVAPVDADKLRLQSLEATVQALQQELANARANPPAGREQQPGQPAGGGSGGADDLPRYNLNLPQNVAAAILGDDPQQAVAGINNMLNSLATIVHHNVRLEMQQRFGQLINAAREQDSQAQTATAIEQAREDYYKAFPAHKDPLILPLIQSETMQMAAEFPGLGWSDQYRNALGQRVEARLAQLRGQGNGGGNPPPSAPAASLPSGPRESNLGGELTGSDLIMDTFSR